MSMLPNPETKYRPFSLGVDMSDRTWPSKTIVAPPRWLSTDLRDGNQALIDPMDAEKKTRFFDLLCKVGLKEIEVGFPSAGATEFDFISGLVKNDRIPEDVIIQVLTQSRRDLIETSFESLRGAPKAIVHLYNAVSPAWRKIVFGMTRDEVRQIAVDGAKILRDCAAAQPNTDWFFEYSPEMKSNSVAPALGKPTSISFSPILTSRSKKRVFFSSSIGSISAWLPSRMSVESQRGAWVMVFEGHCRSGRSTWGKGRYLTDGSRNMAWLSNGRVNEP